MSSSTNDESQTDSVSSESIESQLGEFPLVASPVEKLDLEEILDFDMKKIDSKTVVVPMK